MSTSQTSVKKPADSSGGFVGRTQKRDSRKVLPSVPDIDRQAASTPSSMIDRSSTPRVQSGYGQFFLEYSIMAEYGQLQKQNISGLYVIPSAKSPLVWFGVLFIRQGLYQDGIFKFTLSIPETYPDGGCPRIVFDPPVFHPIINPDTGELDVKRGYPKWRRNVNQLWHVLYYTRVAFYKIDTKSPWNSEAATLYEQNLDEFKVKVSETINNSKKNLYDPPSTDDPHEIRFGPWEVGVHEEARNQMLSPKSSPE
ncbi:LOW QUALITY PROTEIN: AKT-interacting protein-like [Liolophura sinensis]|uniref:LOW QUALITY PROTEIN: AKT-interacting protein-like n=1 Tax=Liolophura sinensis TaxID=3198878 RepID=UPI003158CF03